MCVCLCAVDEVCVCLCAVDEVCVCLCAVPNDSTSFVAVFYQLSSSFRITAHYELQDIQWMSGRFQNSLLYGSVREALSGD